MGEHTTEALQQIMNRLDDEQYARDHFLGTDTFNLDEESFPWFFNHIDFFVSESRGNRRVENLYLNPYVLCGQDDEVWDKVGQTVGNLQALETLHISNRRVHDDDDDDQEVPTPDWRELALILSRMRQIFTVDIDDIDNSGYWAIGEVQALARAIRGHPTIRRFDGNCLPYEASDTLYSALATLPALEAVRLSSDLEDTISLANPESLTELLRVPSLRAVCFIEFDFTSALCQATANALVEGTAFTSMEFNNCSFSAEGSAALMANGLSRNTSVSHIEVVSPPDQALFSALATALPSNSTLRSLSLHDFDDVQDLSRIFLALRKNKGLKTLAIDDFGLMEESLCIAIKDGLGRNETLESLEFTNTVMRDDHTALWCRAFSFLRTNKALKFLEVDVHYGATESCVSTIRSDIACILRENASLESIFILDCRGNQSEEYIAFVTALQYNMTLKTFLFHSSTIQWSCDEDKHMVTIGAILKKNYALESLPETDLDNEAGDIDAILRLNAAGRRYLIEDGSSISKGVEVLSRVNNDIHCVFFHLLENPRLCDRSAVEIASTDEGSNNNSSSSSNSNMSTNPSVSSDGRGKREQASVQNSRESRRRLA
jgi:hypothetical protein